MDDVLGVGAPDLSRLLECSAHTALQPPGPSLVFPEAFGGCLSLSLFYFCQQEEEVGGGKEAGGIRAWLPS